MTVKAKKVLRFVIIGLVVIIFIGALGLVGWSEIGTYPARSVALSALESTDRLTITQGKWITFTPVEEVETGLIFYPGGLVEPSAYAPILHQIAEEGVLVIIVPMPLNLAIFNTGAANSVIDRYPNISTWIISGHSLGGTAAAIFAENYPTKIDAIALWDSYPANSANLSDNSISAISIFGTTDNFPNTNNFDDKKFLLPEDTIFFAIEGASHAQFGDYGPQTGDVVPSISLSEQHERVAEVMLDFIKP